MARNSTLEEAELDMSHVFYDNAVFGNIEFRDITSATSYIMPEAHFKVSSSVFERILDLDKKVKSSNKDDNSQCRRMLSVMIDNTIKHLTSVITNLLEERYVYPPAIIDLEVPCQYPNDDQEILLNVRVMVNQLPPVFWVCNPSDLINSAIELRSDGHND